MTTWFKGLRLHSTIAIAMSAAMVCGASAQKSVDFSGTWVPVNAPAGRGEAREVLVVTQDKTGMTASFSAEGQKTAEVIRYEFGATKIQSTPAGRGDMEVSVASSWKGDTLVAVNTIKMQERTRSFDQTWSLDQSGQLVITVSRPSESGPRVTTTVYKRKPASGNLS